MGGNVNQNNLSKKRNSTNVANFGKFTTPQAPQSNRSIQINFSDSARIKPSNLNIGQNVSVIDGKMADSLFTAYGNGSNKYFNTGYDLHDLYPTTNYASGSNSGSGWNLFGKIMGGILGAGILGFIIDKFTGGGLSSLLGLGSKKSGSTQSDVVVTDNRKKSSTPAAVSSSTQQITGIDSAVSSAKDLSKSNDAVAIQKQIDDLDKIINDSQAEQARLEADNGKAISDQEAAIVQKKGVEEQKHDEYKTLNGNVDVKQKEVDGLNKQLTSAKKSETDLESQYQNLSGQYDLTVANLKKMESVPGYETKPEYTKLKAKVAELKNKRDKARTEAEGAQKTRIQLEQQFGTASDELEKFKKSRDDKEGEWTQAVEDRKAEQQKLKEMKLNQKNLGTKIADAIKAKGELQGRLDLIKTKEDNENKTE